MFRLDCVVRSQFLTLHAGDNSCLASFAHSVAKLERFVNLPSGQVCCRCRWQAWDSWDVLRRNRLPPRTNRKPTRLLVGPLQQRARCRLAAERCPVE